MSINSYAEKWDIVYKSFNQINFSAFDYNTVKYSLVEHIREHYPENFNNFIESDEFIMILESFAYISELFAYRLDMNAHENFIGTAARKESVLRLAQLISYTPTRNLAARGLVKIETVSTTEDVYDSRGRNLSNTTITWNDPNNPFWKEQFILVMNRMMERDFGTVLPEQRFQVNDIVFEQYVLNNNPLSNGVIRYNVDVNGHSYPMEIVSADLDAKGPFEKRPTRNSKLNIIYSYDSIGDSSDSTGFFFYTKQGTLHRLSRTYDGMEPFMVDEIDIDNINDTDVWVNNIDSETGEILRSEIVDGRNRLMGYSGEWESVDTANLYNLSFGSSNRRNKYQIETLERDRVRLVFGDGEFSDIPNGAFDIWVRSSNGSSEFVIPKLAIDNEVVNISYTGRDFQNSTGTFTFSAISNISNARASEDIEHIRRVAPLVYQTQNRMVSGADYNTLPLMDNSIIKLRTLNRTFSGHSKNTFNDPNGIYSDVNWFGEDLSLFIQDSNSSTVAPPDTGYEALVLNVIQPNLIIDGVQSFHRLNNLPMPQNTFSESEVEGIINVIENIENNSGLGYPLGLYYMPNNVPPMQFVNITPGVTLSESTNVENYDQTFLTLTIKYRREGNNSELIQETSLSLPVANIPTWGDVVRELQRQIRGSSLRDDILVSLESGNIRFEVLSRPMNEIIEMNLEDGSATSDPPLFGTLESLVNGRVIQFDEPIAPTGLRPEWRAYMSGVYIPHNPTFTIERLGDGEWVVETNESAVYAESPSTNFWLDDNQKKLHSTSFRFDRDNIRVLSNNLDKTNSRPLMEDLILPILSTDIIRTGISLGLRSPNRVLVEVGNEETSVIDDLFGTDLTYDDRYWTYTTIPDNSIFKVLTIRDPILGSMVSGVDEISLYDENDNPISYAFSDIEGNIIDEGDPTQHLRIPIDSEAYRITNNGYVYFNVSDSGGLELTDSTPNVKRRFYLGDSVERLRGRGRLNYFWKHISSERNLVNPASTNIHDMYVITNGYYNEYVAWINNELEEMPRKPTSTELEMEYRDILDVGMLSDTTIIKHGSIKALFGSKSEQYLRGRFRIIKKELPTLSDNEIVERVISITRDFFRHDNWEMGETFYFSELASKIQSELVSDVKSIIIAPLSSRYGQGHLYQITPETDEIFYPDITPSDIQFVDSYSPRELGQE